MLIDDELNEILVQPLPAGVLGSSGIFIGSKKPQCLFFALKRLQIEDPLNCLDEVFVAVCTFFFFGIPHQQ